MEIDNWLFVFLIAITLFAFGFAVGGAITNFKDKQTNDKDKKLLMGLMNDDCIESKKRATTFGICYGVMSTQMSNDLGRELNDLESNAIFDQCFKDAGFEVNASG